MAALGWEILLLAFGFWLLAGGFSETFRVWFGLGFGLADC
jgi:hypothetical protein